MPVNVLGFLFFTFQRWYWGIQVGYFFFLCCCLPCSLTSYSVMCWLLSNPDYRLQQSVAVVLVFFFYFASFFLCVFSATATLLLVFKHAFQGMQN